MPYYDFLCASCEEESVEYVEYGKLEETEILCSCGSEKARSLPSQVRVEDNSTAQAEEKVVTAIEENREELEDLKSKRVDYEDL